jgi:rhodanese-related sulfurtransferase
MTQGTIPFPLTTLAPLVNIPREGFKRLVNLFRGVRDISVRTAWSMIETQGAQVLDVREPQEFAAGHVPGSRLIPLGSLAARVGELAAFKALPLVVICHGGKRSATACAALARLGFADTYNVAGGILAWRRAGLPEAR